MKKYRLYLLVAVCCYALFLLTRLPASLVFSLAAVPSQTSSQTPVTQTEISAQGSSSRVGAVQGSVWSGSVEGLSVQGLRLARAHWELELPPLLLGRLQYRIAIEDPLLEARGHAGAGIFSGIYAREVEATLSPALLTQLGPLALVKASGKVQASLGYLGLEEWFPSRVEGVLQWQAATLTSPVQLALGDIRLVPRMDAKELVMEINNAQNVQNAQDAVGNHPKISGTLSLAPQGGYRFNANITPDPTMDPGLVSMLESMGRKNPDGGISLRAGKR